MCRKEAELQIRNLFAAKINNIHDEEMYLVTVQEIASAKVDHNKYNISLRQKSQT